MPNIDDPLPLLIAGDLYPRAQDATAVLPVVFGDYISSTHVADDDEDGGFLPAVSIDTDNWVYLLNALPNVTGPIRVYVNDTRQETSVYTYTPMGDYGGTGRLIAYLTFTSDPGSRTISWRGMGARDYPADTLLTNPIAALRLVFGTYGGWTPNDTDWGSVMETQRLMNVLGDTINMVFGEERTYREWLEIVLQLYHCDLGMDANGRLRFMLDTSVTNQPTTTLYHLDARRDLAGAEAEPLTILRDPQDIVTEITVKARRKWTTGDYTAEPNATYAPGVSRHGRRHRRYEMPGLYTFAQYERWLRGMWLRYGMRADRVVFTMRGLSLMSALPGTFLGMRSPKRGWPVAQLLKVLNCDPDDEAQTITFECFDCQRAVDVAATLPVVVMPTVRTRPIRSSPTVDLVPPRPSSAAIAIGSYRRVVLRVTAPGDLDYDHTEIWASQTNNRATATFIRNGGVGVPPGSTWEESFDVADGATWYVWFMTVDDDGNGKNGGTGVTGGNWYPASATGGVVATASLIPTGGLDEAAVTFTYSPGVSAAVTTYNGEQLMVTTILGGTFQQGDVIAFGTLALSIGSLHTVILNIYRFSIHPIQLIGTTPITNPLLVPVTTRFDVWGMDFAPAWNGVYLLTAQSIDQTGTQQNYVFHGGSLHLRHTKR